MWGEAVRAVELLGDVPGRPADARQDRDPCSEGPCLVVAPGNPATFRAAASTSQGVLHSRPDTSWYRVSPRPRWFIGNSSPPGWWSNTSLLAPLVLARIHRYALRRSPPAARSRPSPHRRESPINHLALLGFRRRITTGLPGETTSGDNRRRGDTSRGAGTDRSEGRFHGLRNRSYGTQLVAGERGKGGQDVEGVPVYDTVADAVQGTGCEHGDGVRPGAVRVGCDLRGGRCGESARSSASPKASRLTRCFASTATSAQRA